MKIFWARWGLYVIFILGEMGIIAKLSSAVSDKE